MEGVADRTLMAEQADQAFREIRVVRHRQERCAVARHDHQLTAQQPTYDGETFLLFTGTVMRRSS